MKPRISAALNVPNPGFTGNIGILGATLILGHATAGSKITLVMAGTLRIKGLHSGSNNVTISAGAELVLEPTGQLAFAPTDNDTSDRITGPGTAALNGTLLFKLGNADLTDGNSWTIIDAPGSTTNLAGIASTNPALTGTITPPASGRQPAAPISGPSRSPLDSSSSPTQKARKRPPIRKSPTPSQSLPI